MIYPLKFKENLHYNDFTRLKKTRIKIILTIKL